MTVQTVIFFVIGLFFAYSLFVNYPFWFFVFVVLGAGAIWILSEVHQDEQSKKQAVKRRSRQFISDYKSNLKHYLSKNERLSELEEAFRTLDDPKAEAASLKVEVLREFPLIKPARVDVVGLLELCLKFTGEPETAQVLYDQHKRD